MANRTGVCDDAVNLLESLLVYDPSRRYGCREALDHPYFQDDD